MRCPLLFCFWVCIQHIALLVQARARGVLTLVITTDYLLTATCYHLSPLVPWQHTNTLRLSTVSGKKSVFYFLCKTVPYLAG